MSNGPQLKIPLNILTQITIIQQNTSSSLAEINISQDLMANSTKSNLILEKAHSKKEQISLIQRMCLDFQLALRNIKRRRMPNLQHRQIKRFTTTLKVKRSLHMTKEPLQKRLSRPMVMDFG